MIQIRITDEPSGRLVYQGTLVDLVTQIVFWLLLLTAGVFGGLLVRMFWADA